MPHLSRRVLLASSTALLATNSLAAAAPSGPPVAPVRPVTETLWGVKVTDRYRWMESEDAEWQKYVRAQGAYAQSVLDKIPGRDALADKIDKNTAAVAIVDQVETGGTKIFAEIRPAGANTTKLFVRDTLEGAQTKLIDPDSFATAGSHASLDWWQISPDGSHVVFGISLGGSEHSTLRIITTATGALLPESINRTEGAGPSWLPDGSGFFYNRYQNVPQDSVEYEEKSLCWLHMLGTDPAQDRKIFGIGLDPAVPIQDIDSPYITVTPGSPIAIGAVISGVQIEVTLYSAPLSDVLAGKPHWTKICDPSDGVTEFAVQGETIYLLTHKNAPRYRVLKTTGAAPGIANAIEVVPQSDSVIGDIAAARDALYIRDLDAGLGGVRRLAPDGTITKIPLPFAGAIFGDADAEYAAFYTDTLHDGVWFSLEGWVHPEVICHATAAGTVQTNIAPLPDIDVSPYTSEEVFATARDGTRIPLSLVYKKGLVRNGQAPLLLDAYGAYGLTLDPGFIARWLPFLDLGGVFAVAHVRGGGELGEDWHRAGQKLTKYHTWQDDIDCAEALIRQGWTSRKKLAIVGGSAGGITVGRFMTERPDLAAVVIDEVGVSDALRSEFSPNGPVNIPEFGSVTTEQGFRGLLAMDAYQHVHDGVKYPSVLLTTGLNDPRVSSWEPTKMTARLQAATSSGNPVLLRVETDAGHGIGSTRTQRDLETADIIAFIMWRTGDPRFQPKT